MDNCTIVHTMKGKHVDETMPYLKNIVKFIENNIYYQPDTNKTKQQLKHIQFNQLVGDFIKDESGTWWLINIKAYQL